MTRPPFNEHEALLLARIEFLRAKRRYRIAIREAELAIARSQWRSTLPAMARRQAGTATPEIIGGLVGGWLCSGTTLLLFKYFNISGPAEVAAIFTAGFIGTLLTMKLLDR